VNTSFDRLDFVLGQQVAGLTALKNWLPRKFELLNAPNPSELEALNAREDTQLQRMRQLEAERRVLEGMLRKDLGLDPDASLPQMLTHASGAVRHALEAKFLHLQQLVRDIRNQNAVAQGLIRRSKVVVDATLDAFAELSSAQSAPTYAGDAHRSQAQTWMVNRTA
jgi:hypothetical protein